MRKKFFSCVCVFALALGLSLVAAAQDKKDKQDKKDMSWTGNIVDKACSAKATTAETAMAHKKSCALSPGCSKSGYGVFADGKYTEFDDNGNELAKAALEKSAKANGAIFKVMGKVADGKLKVDSITEVE